MLDVQTLAARYVAMQHEAAHHADDTALRQHISDTLCRCLPPQIVTTDLVDDCFRAVCSQPGSGDPMYTGAIHAFAGELLRHAASADPLMNRLHVAAHKLLQQDRAATREELRLVTLSALYEPQRLPPGEITAFVRHRLGLKDGLPRSCEEIAFLMHKPLVYIHELESAVLTTLSSHDTGGHHA